MLETDYLNDIVSKFYISINNSASNEEKSLSNPFYFEKKNIRLAKIALIMTTLIIILTLTNYMISTGMLGPFLYTDLNDKITKTENELDTYRKAVAAASSNEREIKDQLLKEAKYELELLYREKRNRTMNFSIRMVIPIFVVIFVIAMMFASLKKTEDKAAFNQEMIENNTHKLKNLVQDLKDKVDVLQSLITDANKFKNISQIPEITDQQKADLFENIKAIVERYEKCNFILEGAKSQLPFPYSEVAMSGFMVFVTVLCILYVFMQLSPTKRLAQIKELNKMRAEAAIADKAAIRAMKKELDYISQCHEDDLDTVVFTLKVVFFVFIIAFLVFYSTKVVSSSNEYKMGLYNSGYFETENCVT
jgi:hypothetical protein